MDYIKSGLLCLIFLSGSILFLINIYGLFRSIRPSNITVDHLRFKGSTQLPFGATMQAIQRKPGELDESYMQRICLLISQSMAHIAWDKYDNSMFYQLIPIWENYFLYFMGKYSGIPEYSRYHFANYRKSLERGIGVCGDASMIMSQLLEKQGITNKIVSFPSHVVVEAKHNDNKFLTLDPDFGVALPFSIEKIHQNPQIIDTFYTNKGHKPYDVGVLIDIYNSKYRSWNNVKHFIKKKYWFEKLAYLLKWSLPVFMIIISLIFCLN